MTKDDKEDQISANYKTFYRCSFCGKSQAQVQRLIAGPGRVYICDECIDLHRKRIEDEWVASAPHPDQNTSTQPKTTAHDTSAKKIYHCSFCGKHQNQAQCLIAGPGGVYICDECISLCQEIIQQESENGKR